MQVGLNLVTCSCASRATFSYSYINNFLFWKPCDGTRPLSVQRSIGPVCPNTQKTKIHRKVMSLRFKVGLAMFAGLGTLTASLGMWQLDRRRWKMQLIADRQREFAAPPVPVTDVAALLQRRGPAEPTATTTAVASPATSPSAPHSAPVGAPPPLPAPLAALATVAPTAVPGEATGGESSSEGTHVLRRVQLTGTLLYDKTVLVGPRTSPKQDLAGSGMGLQHASSVGYYVMTPLRCADGCESVGGESNV